MLAEAVALHDIKDADAFVQATINRWQRATRNRGRISLSPDERDELACEGLAILYKLSGDYEPHRAGYAHAGRFSGYAAMFLPRKLGDAWHRMHAEHQLVTQPDGSRRWEYTDRPVSLEAMTAEEPDRHDVLIAPPDAADPIPQVRTALDERWQRRRTVLLDIGDLLAASVTREAAATRLGLTPAQVQAAAELIFSLKGLLEETDATQPVRSRVAQALDAWWLIRRGTILDVASLLSEGATWQDAAARLQLDASQVYEAVSEIRLAASRFMGDSE